MLGRHASKLTSRGRHASKVCKSCRSIGATLVPTHRPAGKVHSFHLLVDDANMKLNLLSFLSATAASAAPSKDALLHEVREKIVPLLNRHSHRMLQLTDECLAATDANIASNDTYLMSLQLAMMDCTQATQIAGDGSILIDYSVCDPEFSAAVEEACTGVGGEFQNKSA